MPKSRSCFFLLALLAACSEGTAETCAARAARAAAEHAELQLDRAPERDRARHREARIAALTPVLQAGCPREAQPATVEVPRVPPLPPTAHPVEVAP